MSSSTIVTKLEFVFFLPMVSDLFGKDRLHLVSLLSKVNFYKKQADELEDRLAILKENENKDEENNPFAKQMASLRVRPVFDDCNTQAGPSFSRRC